MYDAPQIKNFELHGIYIEFAKWKIKIKKHGLQHTIP